MSRMSPISTRLLTLFAAGALAASLLPGAAAADPVKIRISWAVAPAHITILGGGVVGANAAKIAAGFDRLDLLLSAIP